MRISPGSMLRYNAVLTPTKLVFEITEILLKRLGR